VADLELRARAARARLALADLFAYNPLQPRGPDGRWIKAGAGVPSAPSVPGKKAAAPRKKAAPARPAGASGWLDEAKSGKLSAATKKRVSDMLTFTDLQTGTRTEVTGVEPVAGGRIQAQVKVYNADGQWIGQAVRTIEPPKKPGGKTRIYHNSFQLSPRAQGGGFSSRWLRRMEDRYREQGIGEIALTTQDVGGYAWAKAGFDFSDRKEAQVAAASLGRKLKMKSWRNQMTQRQITDGEELIRRAKTGGEDFPTPAEFAMLGWMPGLETWVGKEAMLGTGWHGVKEL
jgi:GNAT superfamily N-acetyltransferase